MARERRRTLMTGSLEEKAMLVRLSQGKWTARKKSVVANNKIQEIFRTEKGQTSATHRLDANDKLITEINAELDYAANWHRAHTLPWSDDSFRILSASMYTEYMAVMRKCTDVIREKAKKVSDNMEAIKEKAQVALGGHVKDGGLYDPADYPTDILSKYRNEVIVMPIPAKGDFRVTHISEEDIAAIEQEIEERYQTAEKKAMEDLYDRVKTLMEEVHSAFSNPDFDFRDSKIEKVTMLMDSLPKLNISGDVNLDRMRKVIETKICTLNPKELRTDINARKNAAEDARKILAQMDEYC